MDVPEVLKAHRGDRGAALARIAGLQEGLVKTEQLRLLGMTASAVSKRHGRHRLHRLHRGVYLLGHEALTTSAPLLAASFAGGDRALVAHASAAFALGLLPQPRSRIDLIVAAARRDRDGLRFHEGLPAQADIGHIGLIPLTGPLRTLVDLAATTDGATLERALDEARIRRLVRERDLERLSARFPGHHGLRPLAALLTTQAGPDFSRSEAERRLLRLIREAGLPHPRRNVRVAGWEVDFLWPDHGLIIEVDGYRFHGDRTPFERDRTKTIELEDAGYSVLRLTWKQISEREAWVAARIAERLARGRQAMAMGPAPGT